MGMQEILQLSVSERLFPVEAICDCMINDPKSEQLELSDATKNELDKRMASHLKNPTSGSPWEEVKTRLQKGK